MAWGWRPYVRVSQRRAKATRHAAALAKKGHTLVPVRVTGRNIAATFWGQAWCENLECYSDFANRLPRGRTYLRNGSVIDLQINPGQVTAQVCGSDIYHVEIHIRELSDSVWKVIKRDRSESIHSLLDLLQGRFSKAVMERLTRPRDGLFPHPKEISMRCSCPDWAVLCKHVAAVLYGVGARLDKEPELLFQLRAVDHRELVQQALSNDTLDQALDSGQEGGLAGENLGELFGIELDDGSSPKAAQSTRAGAKKRGKPQRSPKKGTSKAKPEAKTASPEAAKRTVKKVRTTRTVVKRATVKRTTVADETNRTTEQKTRKAGPRKSRGTNKTL